MVVPAALLEAARFAQSEVGLYVAAIARVAIGLVLVGAAVASRAPRTLRIVGAFTIVAGIITPFFGVERVRAMVEWWSAQGVPVVRSVAAAAGLLGLFIIYALAPRR